MKKPKQEEKHTVEIVSDTIDGKGIARIDQKVVFVKETVKGDVCEISTRRNHKKHAEATVSQLLNASPLRITPHCKHYHLCGGCSLQHMTYAHQLEIKHQFVKDALDRIGKINYEELKPILGAEKTTHYRNKLDFAFSSKRWLNEVEIKILPEGTDRTGLGFHLSGMFDKVLDIQECFHQDDRSNLIRNFIREEAKKRQLHFYDVRLHEGDIRNLIIRNTTLDHWMVIVCFAVWNEAAEALMHAIAEKFSYINALLYAVNTKKNDVIYDLDIHTFKGEAYILEQLGDYKFKIRPKSFFQTNSQQAKLLYDQIVKLADIRPDQLVYDLYSGVGSIAIYVSGKAKEVIGIEVIEDAVKDAQENAILNKVQNVSFYSGNMKEVLTMDFLNENGHPDMIITDPPRAGMDAEVVQMLLDLKVPKIVYVSCNPTTQARDLALLQEKYHVAQVQPVDMFPHTAHVESIALLTLK